MSLTDALSSKREEITNLIRRTHASVGTEQSDLQQLLTGYLTMLTAAANGDYGPREQYLDAVIPALRESGISLADVIAGVVRFAMATATVLGPDHAEWLCSFHADHVTRIVQMWERT